MVQKQPSVKRKRVIIFYSFNLNIGINTRFLLPNKMEGFGWYTYEITKRLVENHPEHTFYFFFDRPFDKQFIFGENVVPVVLNPPARHPILFYVYFEFAITKALKKYKIDVFFSPDGYLSLRTKTPQIGVIHDLNFEHYPEDIPTFARYYLKHFFPKFAKKATKIITVSNYSKSDLIKTYQIPSEKITVAYNDASADFQPLTQVQIEEVRAKYTDGKPYFLFVGALHPRKNIQRLITAFSEFVLQTQSTTQLVLVGSSLWGETDYLKNIPQKIREQIRFIGYQQKEDLVKITAAAHMLTYIPYFEGFGIPLVEAMRCGVPILTSNVSSLPEVLGNAGLICNPFDIDSIVHQMINFESNITLQHELKQLALERAKTFSWDQSAGIVWEEIEKLF